MKKQIHFILILSFLLVSKINFSQINKTVGTNIPISSGQIQNRGCATPVPSQKWENQFQQLVAEYLQQHPEEAKMIANSSTMAGYSIPVIMHVIHGGQAVGTFPNLAQGQLTSQVTVLDNDFSGIGQNVGNYPATAFTTFATNPLVSAASKDGSGRIAITNCNVNFCLATKDTLGNILAEPGIHRVNYNSLPATSNPSKNPAATNYNTQTLFTNFMNSYIKPNTIWNVSKYLNIWVTDRQNATGLLGYATFPPLSTLSGIPGGVGTATSDGFWSWAASFGSSTIFPGGTYAAPYDKGRTCTHEIGHWLGLRHIWGDGSCLTDYCTDTPPAGGSNFGSPTYPLTPNSCNAASPPTGVNGEMFMNFMDYTDDLAMYMFTNDQRTRVHVAMSNSPYRKFLGTHGLCNLPAPIANFSVAPNPVCNGAILNIGDLSLNVPSSWSYTMSGGTPSISTAQNPTVSFTSPGIYSITLVATNGAGPSIPITQTVSVIAGPTFTLSSNPSSTLCAGNSATISMLGGTSYTLLNTGSTTAPFIVTPTVATIYSISAVSAGTNTCKRTQTLSIAIGSVAININPTVASVCSGQSVALTGSGAATYTWSTGSNATSISVTPTAATIYTLNGTNGGCIGTKTVQVNINASPTISVNNATTCPSNLATLAATGANTYTWNTGPNTAAISVSPIVSTTYTVSGTNALGCVSSKTASVIVNPTPTISVNNATICPAGTATLIASGANTYLWSTTSTASSITVSPPVNTTYTVTGTSLGCSNTKTVSVSIGASISINLSANPTNVCIGGSSTLTASGATNYTWSTGPNGSSIVVSPTANTTYTVVGTNGSCSGTNTISLVVNQLAASALAGPNQTLCISNPATTLAGNTPSIGTGSWSVVAGVATIANPNLPNTAISGVTSIGINILQWQITNGACSSISTMTVTVDALPTSASSIPSQTVCSSSATLTGNSPSVGAGAWSLVAGAGAITSPNSLTTGLTGLGAGTNIFQWTISNGPICPPSTSTVSVTKSNTPTVTAVTASSIICVGSTVNITASGASTYSWSTGATTSVIAVSPSVTTTYTVDGSNGPCSSAAVITQSVSTCTGLNQLANQNYNVLVYPNPFKEELTFNAGELVTAQVFNTLGQLIIVKTINGIGAINTAELAKGVYYLNVKGISGSKTLKIVKE